MKQPDIIEAADVAIVGAGAAGLFTALSLAASSAGAQKRIVVISEKPLGGICASAWSQGGIAAAVGPNDTPANHATDTLRAAAGTADTEVVRLLTTEAPHIIDTLDKIGVRFEREADGSYRLSREACHDRRRVLRAAAGDGFGRELMRALVAAVEKNAAIIVVENIAAERILRRDGQSAGPVQGILGRRLDNGAPVAVAAACVVLATGGLGGLYAATTNPLGAVGRGLAMAARAGAVLADLEFVQFHPTALDIGADPMPLASEALRGEGALLVNDRGERFMTHYHPMAELAPRDVVSRGIFAEMQKGRKVYLDCRPVDTAAFPALRAAAATAGLDPQKDLMPVSPAVHYHMGGVATDLNGRTSLQGLWACGEVAATGLHGANRLASNSLMEAVVMGGRVAADILQARVPAAPHLPAAALPAVPQSQDRPGAREALRHIMSDHVGVIRHHDTLLQALREIAALETMASRDDSRLADMALVARMITTAALQRTESRGAHCRSDAPDALPAWEKRSFTTLKESDAAAVVLRTAPARRKEGAA